MDLVLLFKLNLVYLVMNVVLVDLCCLGNLFILCYLRDGYYSGSKILGNVRDYKYFYVYFEKWVK